MGRRFLHKDKGQNGATLPGRLKGKGMGKGCYGFFILHFSNNPRVVPACTSRLLGLALAKLQARATSCPDPNCRQSREDSNVARKVPPSPWEMKPMLQEMFTLGKM